MILFLCVHSPASLYEKNMVLQTKLTKPVEIYLSAILFDAIRMQTPTPHWPVQFKTVNKNVLKLMEQNNILSEKLITTLMEASTHIQQASVTSFVMFDLFTLNLENMPSVSKRNRSLRYLRSETNANIGLEKPSLIIAVSTSPSDRAPF